jgi:hypothetical protein
MRIAQFIKCKVIIIAVALDGCLLDFGGIEKGIVVVSREYGL